MAKKVASQKKKGKKQQKNKLTAKQACFVQEYLIDLNATQAAIRAGYSKKVAKVQGCQNLTKANIQAALNKAMGKRAEKTQITQEMVLREYAKIAFLDPRKFFDEQGVLIPIHTLDGDVAAAVAGMDVSEIATENAPITTLKKLKFSDKKAALDSIGKHLGMFIDNKHFTGDLSINLIDSFAEDGEDGEQDE